MNDTFSVPPGGQVLSHGPIGFGQIYGIWVDNFSGGWLGIEGQNLWVPPYTRGWKASILPGISSISIQSYDFANGTTIGAATGQAAKVTIWDTPKGDAEGIDFFDAQTVPLVVVRNIVDGVGAIVVPAPPVGRLRIYDISCTYQISPADIYETLLIMFLTTIVGTDLGVTSLSPATPYSYLRLTNPGSDLPLGAGFTALPTITDAMIPGGSITVRIVVRYAIR